MAADSPCNVRVSVGAVPLLPSAKELAAMGLVPDGTYRNRSYRLPFVENAALADDDLLNVLFDPQTSGGLLAAVASRDAPGALDELHAAGVSAVTVGETVPGKGLVELV
jgi:selenide,water dikinase